MTRLLLPLFFLLGCPAKPDDSGVETDTDTDTDADTDTDTDACETMTPGEDWAFNGQCPQMLTPCEIEVDGCSLTITYSSGMTMGMPYGGTISGSTITFEDGDSVTGCVGTLEDADSVSGTCDGGCTYTLRR